MYLLKLRIMSSFCVLISLQSSEEEEGCLCGDAGLGKGHVETGLSEVVVGPLLGEVLPMQLLQSMEW